MEVVVYPVVVADHEGVVSLDLVFPGVAARHRTAHVVDVGEGELVSHFSEHVVSPGSEPLLGSGGQ